MARRAMTDTGFWIAWLDPRDEFHSPNIDPARLFAHTRCVIPWPILYETIRTRTSKRTTKLFAFLDFVRSPSVELIDDSDYRLNALSELSIAVSKGRPMSLVDVLCRLVLSDVRVNIDQFLTANVRDFADVCKIQRIELMSVQQLGFVDD